MRYRVDLVVSLKDGLLDPQGKAVEGALPSLGWNNVSHVSVGKYVRFAIDAPDEASARAQVQEMAERFLTNPVIEDFRVVELSGLSDGAVEVRP